MDSRAISRRDLEELEEILRGGTAVREFLSGLFEVSLTMGAVTALLLILSPVWKRRFRPQWRCWAWLLVALRLAVPFNVSLPRAPVVLEAPPRRRCRLPGWRRGIPGVELTARTLPPGEAAPEAVGRGCPSPRRSWPSPSGPP
ncbi:M56 family metallopeptidase [Flavonifractor plautii]|nr:M56 family metallopeptidase [Flavonifractor plautii]